ncbi:MAG: hypothetical protein ABH986_04190, partial [archaeon]
MISEKLGGIYSSLENKFYGFFDFLEEKGLPVYGIIDPIEGKGIPFFPLSIALIVVLLVGLFGFGVIGTSFDAQIQLNLKDTYGSALQQVKVTATDATGQELFSGTKNNADKISVKVNSGAELTLTAEKQGYESNETTIKVINEETSAELALKKLINTVKAKIKFFDEETGTSISGVYATIDWKEIHKEATADSFGVAEFIDVPLEETLYITAKGNSYYEYTGTVIFESEETKSIYLSPKEIAFGEQSNLIITLFDSEGKLLENTKVKVFNSANELIDERIVEDGVYSENFPTGSVVRFTVEKQGFKSFESSEFTLRSEEENLGSVELEKGGKELTVTAVYSDTKNPIVGAEITLFNSKNEIVDSGLTLYEGIKAFNGLNEDENYFIGAEKDSYLPALKEMKSETETIELEKATTANSAELTVLVIDAEENTIENASLNFTQMQDTTEVPLGLGVKKTNNEGKFTISLPLNAEITVNAAKDLLEGKETILIGEYNNNLLITLEKKDAVKSIVFYDETGKIVSGNLVIKTASGEILFDGEITEEEILFDAGENNFVEIELTTTAGKTFTEEISLEGKTDLEVNFDSREYTEETPKIEFLGVYDLAGNEVEGITKGKEFILKFQTDWKKGIDAGGIHFRTGSDSIKYSDSESIGITGFDAPATKYFYGRSFSPSPAPGNKEIDYSNKGQGGKSNKLIEIYFDKPSGTKIIKVRVKANELISESSVKVKFRAWSVLNSNYSRNPFDSVLGKSPNSEERQGLYAETSEITLQVYDSEPKCLEEVCAEYNIIDSTGRIWDKKDFFAVKGKVYALEINLEARKTVQASIKLNTSSETPRIAFTGSETDSFSQFVDNNKSDTLIELTETIPREGKKIRVYFKAKETGESFVKSRLTTPKDSMTENFYFKVFEEKEMEINIPESVQEGKSFEIKLMSEGTGIEDAVITFFDAKGRIEKTVIGNEFNGSNGVYKIENNVKAGKYSVKISAPKFIEEEKEIQIVYGTGIELQEKISVIIPVNEKFVSEKVKLTNNTQNLVENLSAEIIPAKNFPTEFKLSVNVSEILNSGEEGTVEVIAEYSGNTNAVVYGKADVIISGEIDSVPIKAKTTVEINYNQKLDEKCLEFDRTELKEYLIGAQGNSKQLELGLKNNCGVPLELQLEVTPKNTDKEIEFSAGTIRLEKDEIKTIKIDVVNKIQRNYVQQTTLEYDVFFKSSQLTKTIPAKIILWNELFSLSVSPTIVLWLTQSNKTEEGIAAQPIYIRNTGLADIENLSFATKFTKPGNTEIQLLYGNTPEKSIEILKRGMGVIPPIVIQAKTNTTENQVIIGSVIVSGVIEGRQYTLREITVVINVSAGWSCLEAWSDDLLFNSPNAEIGAIDKLLNITNRCTEPVIIKGIEPKTIGGNEINLVDYDYALNPGVSDEFVIRLTKRNESNQKTSIKVLGVGKNSGKLIYSMPAEIELAIGKGTGLCGTETEPCKGENETVIEYCDETGNTTVFFPKESANCSEGYCDAEQLGKFLGEKFQDTIRKAQLRIAELKSAENLGSKCNLFSGYCSFGAMGISGGNFEFYLKNDNLSQDMLKNEITKLESKELQNYIVRTGENENDLYSSAGVSFGEHLLLVPQITGCGKYSAKILGAVSLSGTEFKSNSVSLLLQIENKREETPECTNRIQNFRNFIPVNESYSVSNSRGSWLGTIIFNAETQELEKSFSKTLFKDEKGLRITTSMENNFIKFFEGNFDSTKGIVKISMERAGESNEPKEIDVYITDDFFGAPDEVKKDIAEEAGTIISNLKTGRIEKGCISRNEDYLILGSVKDIAQIANLQWKDTTQSINLYPDEYSCADLKLESKIEAPEIKVEWNLVDNEPSGIHPEETVFKYNKDKDGRNISNPSETSFNASWAEWKQEGNNYVLEFQLCFKGSDTPRDAIGSKIKLTATGLKERELIFGLCSITPIEFIERAQSQKQPGEYYATVNWDG